MGKIKRSAKKIAVGVIGGLVLCLGLLTIPYPGPGWLTVFVGLGILATEFDWAQRLLDIAKSKYDEWQAWLKVQKPTVKVAFWALTALVVVATIWLLNGYGLLAQLFGLDLPWVRSPLPWFS